LGPVSQPFFNLLHYFWVQSLCSQFGDQALSWYGTLLNAILKSR
jgi:hypothetical protein